MRPEPTGVTISGGDAALRPGDKTTLTAAVSPAGALQDVTWSSGDSAVATVDSNTGEVTAVASGEAVITATSARDTGISATKTITVTPVKVQTLTLNHDALIVEVTDTAQLTATAAPADAADKSVSWASSNDDVATVDSSGKVTAVAMGEATVTATAKDGSSGGITGGGGVHNGSSSGSASRKPAEPAAPATKPAVPSVPEVKADNARSFLDVPENHWAAGAIAYVSGRGIINGMSPATLSPHTGATRAQTAAILMRFCENVLK